MRTRLRQASPRPARKSPAPTAPVVSVESVIHTVRDERVILDADLAKLYGVPTKALNQAVRRNREKFPPDFLFQLTSIEAETVTDLRSQIVTASPLKASSMRSQIVTASKRNIRHSPFAFTEHGAIMAANILNSPQAVQMSVFVVRAFVKMRGLLTDTREETGHTGKGTDCAARFTRDRDQRIHEGYHAATESTARTRSPRKGNGLSHRNQTAKQTRCLTTLSLSCVHLLLTPLTAGRFAGLDNAA